MFTLQKGKSHVSLTFGTVLLAHAQISHLPSLGKELINNHEWKRPKDHNCLWFCADRFCSLWTLPFQKVLNHTSRFAISLQFECNLRQAVSRTVLSKITRKVLLHQSWSGGKHLTPLEASPYLHSFPDDYKPHSLCAYIHQNQPPAVLLLLFTHAQFFVTSWTVARQAPLSTGFPRQEYWRGYHFFLQGIFLTGGLNPCLLHYRWILYLQATWEAPASLQFYFSSGVYDSREFRKHAPKGSCFLLNGKPKLLKLE